ncbi:MAG: hypothetical protein HRU36_01955 [Rickettsiales bacterium]|nr:hypothetical protein [Rickettsiales bacterium]
MVSHIDIAIVIAYMFFCLVIGLLKYGKIKNIRDYTLGTKPFPTIVLMATTLATVIGTGRIIGNTEKVYELGIIYMISFIFVPISWLILTRMLLPNIQIFRKHKFISLSDIMEYWYGKLGRWVTNVISILIAVAVAASSAIAIGYLLHHFLGISETIGIIIGLGVVTIYSAFGGITSVAFTDVFQFLIFFIALPIACFISYQDTGGLEKIWHSLPETHTHIKVDNIPLFVSFIFYSSLPYIDISSIQRVLIAKDREQLLRAFIGVAILTIPLMMIVCFIASVTYHDNPNIESGKVLYHFIDNYLPPVLKGFMIAGILAVIMSTQDSYLNTTGVLISHDVCKQIWPSLTDRQELFIARISCVVIALISISMIVLTKGIMDMIWIAGSFSAPLVATPLMAGLIGARINKSSFIGVVIFSLIAIVITRFVTGVFDTRSLAVGMVTSAIVLYILHKRNKGESVFSFPRINVNLLFNKLNEQVLNSSYSINSLYRVGVVLCGNFLVGVAFANLDFFTPFNVTLIVISSLLMLLLLNEFWNYRLKRYSIDIWKACLTIGLLFVPSYIFFAHDFHMLWLCNLILSTILFIVMSDIVVGIAFAAIAGSIGYLLSQIFYFNVSLVSREFGNISCAAMLIAIVIQIYNRHTITKNTYREIMREVDRKTEERAVELKKALNIKKEFLNKLSHEIKNPIHNMLALSEGMYDSWYEWSEEERQTFIKGVIDSKKSLMDYTSSILDLALLEEEKMPLDIKKGVDLIDLAKDAINRISPLVIKQNKNIGVELEIQASKPAIVKCDSKRISQVIDSILKNAITYTQYGTIKLSIDTKKDYVRVSIADPGVGIPDDEKLEIFTPFFEGSRTKSLARGKGVGLSIAQKIMILHGSTIQVKDNESKPTGSVFSFILPSKDLEF